MPTFTATRDYQDGDLLLDSDFDAFLDDLESFLNITKINNDNLQDGGLTASAKLRNASVTEAKLPTNAINSDKLATSAVVEAAIDAAAVTEIKLATDAVQTADLGDIQITTAKLAADVAPAVKELTRATFTASGSWTVPDNVKQIILEGCGGGGGGGGSACSSGAAAGTGFPCGGAGGGGASPFVARRVSVTPGQILLITIGTGGTGGAGAIHGDVNPIGQNGSAGGDTFVTDLSANEFFRATGGTGGVGGLRGGSVGATIGGSAGGVYGGGSGNGAQPSYTGFIRGLGGSGGPSTASEVTTITSGQGGTGFYQFATPPEVLFTPGGAAAVGPGAGGGGASGVTTTTPRNGATGGTGAPGILYIWY